ncbi:hypothetical protein [Prosthecobacter vanneervenii]|uniref:Glycosyltransferase RgtA/B/C/D-like domain-containing protein n=1 Tax=Prosthecobacter vanneervenii TaxID=48466 RepID=A0A7W8DHZ2_9BACT|nr:hypothetical protein [Prosthecobacter vanneervenii]MBB5030483.1 hypothetical protein [Prosthecobacter vanneervenii]
MTLLLQGHTLLRPMLITDDIAQHHVWLDAVPGSGFQPDDPWIKCSKVYQPYLAAAAFQAVHLVLPTLLVGKAIALVLLALTAFLVFQIGIRLGGTRLGWIAMGLFFLSDGWIGISGGFSRSFAWPLVSGFLLALLSRRPGIAALCLFLAAPLYPMLFVLLAPVYAIVWLYEEFRTGWRQTFNLRTQWQAQWPLLLAVLAGSALVLLKSREMAMHPFMGPQVTLAQIQTDPLFGVGGRVVLWPQPPLYVMLPGSLFPWGKVLVEPVLRHLAAKSAALAGASVLLLYVAAVLAFVLSMFILWRRSREKTVVLLALAVVSTVAFQVAVLLLPKLFEASRYLMWSIPPLGLIAWSVLLDSAIGLVSSKRALQVLFALLAVLYVARAPAIRGQGAEDSSEYSPLYSALAHTGAGELIASFPRTADLIPVLCHRSVFVSNESSHAVMFTRCRQLIMERHSALLKAFYSPSSTDVRCFCKDNKISWLVVEEKYYRPDMAPGMHFAPFEQQMRDMLKQTPQPWLLAYARKAGKQVQPGVYLLDTGHIQDLSAQ